MNVLQGYVFIGVIVLSVAVVAYFLNKIYRALDMMGFYQYEHYNTIHEHWMDSDEYDDVCKECRDKEAKKKIN